MVWVPENTQDHIQRAFPILRFEKADSIGLFALLQEYLFPMFGTQRRPPQCSTSPCWLLLGSAEKAAAAAGGRLFGSPGGDAPHRSGAATLRALRLHGAPDVWGPRDFGGEERGSFLGFLRDPKEVPLGLFGFQ